MAFNLDELIQPDVLGHLDDPSSMGEIDLVSKEIPTDRVP
jgi:hypothetical protein